MHARRATPMYLVEDLDEARLRYVSLGFVPKDTDDEGCCGVSAGLTHIILLNRDYAERSLPPRAVTLLEERPALYIWVEIAGRRARRAARHVPGRGQHGGPPRMGGRERPGPDGVRGNLAPALSPSRRQQIGIRKAVALDGLARRHRNRPRHHRAAGDE